MNYKIGEVSKMFNISKEMLRYYEKKGVLHPKRIDENNYHVYDEMDIFLLFEIVQYQAMNFHVADIAEMLSNNYMENYAGYLEKYESSLRKEIAYKMILERHIHELTQRAQSARYNIGHYYFRKINHYKLISICHSHHEQYSRIAFDQETSQMLNSNNHMAFAESLCLFKENQENWYFGFDQQDIKDLDIQYNQFKELKSGLCICTTIDMGAIGSFSSASLSSIMKYVEENHYIINGEVRGVIIGRGYEAGKFSRVMEIQIPVEQ